MKRTEMSSYQRRSAMDCCAIDFHDLRTLFNFIQYCNFSACFFNAYFKNVQEKIFW